MTHYFRFSLALLMLLGLNQLAQAETVLKTNPQKAGYSIGIDFASSLKSQGLDIDFNSVILGIQDTMKGKKPLLSQEERAKATLVLQKQMMAKREAKMAKLGAENKKKGKAFLAANKKKAGVETLKSGLQYKILKHGDGPSPKATDQVTTNYRGTLIDGTEFDSSYKRGKPATFPVKGVIQGWQEALQKMKVGDKWQLVIPPNLAYGKRGAGETIGPNATLIFEIELLKIGS